MTNKIKGEDLWEECVVFHGHACPGIATGFRVATFAMEQLGLPLAKVHDESIVCVAENKSCGVAGVQHLLGCTTEKGNLIVKPMGDMAYSFYDKDSGKSVRVLMKPFERSEDHKETMKMILHAPSDTLFEVMKVESEIPVCK